MKNAIRFFVVIGLVGLLEACTPARVSPLQVNPNTHPSPISTIAVSSGSSLISEAIAIQLSNYGYNVIDPGRTAGLIARLNLAEADLSTPAGLKKLKKQGIDAYLTVKGDIVAASARVTSTHSGQIIAGVLWESGSFDGNLILQSLTEVAKAMVKELVKHLPEN